jgi:hypothetical protein
MFQGRYTAAATTVGFMARMFIAGGEKAVASAGNTFRCINSLKFWWPLSKHGQSAKQLPL